MDLSALDARIHPYREDLAAASLKGTVDAPRYAEPKRMAVAVSVADMLVSPDGKGGLGSQLRAGEAFDVYDTQDGVAWGQSVADGYVGYVDASALKSGAEGDQRITALITTAYDAPNIKSRPLAALPHGAQVVVLGREGAFVETLHGFVPNAHLEPSPEDPVGTAEMYLDVPYLWGGRSYFGLDCSALVQMMAESAQVACPRDSDMQQALGTEPDTLARGDLVFWKGHVGIMRDAETLLHATEHRMRVLSEPLASATKRIAENGGGPITAQRRFIYSPT